MSSDKQSKPDGNLPCPDQIGSSDHDAAILLPSAEAYSACQLKASHPSENPFLNRLLEILDKYRDLGEIAFPNGTMSIGKIPSKEKWFLIHLYSGLSVEQIEKMASCITNHFPKHLKRFYSVSNGMQLFGAGQFRLWGYRASARQDMPNYQPPMLFTKNPQIDLGIMDAPNDAIFIGGYFGYYFYTIADSEIIYACKSPDATPIEQWPTIEAMVLDVAKRLSVWFDENAQPIGLVNEKAVLFELN